jgi:hypothetical protein
MPAILPCGKRTTARQRGLDGNELPLQNRLLMSEPSDPPPPPHPLTHHGILFHVPYEHSYLQQAMSGAAG